MTETLCPFMKSLCLVTAVDVEFNAVTSLLTSRTFSDEFQIKTCQGNVGQGRVTVLQCGMGAPAFTNRLSEHLQHHRYDGLIVAGLAGGLDPELKLGDAVIYDLCHDARDLKEKPSGCDQNATIRCEDQISEFLFRSLQSAGRRSFRGSGVTVNRIITKARDKISLGDLYQAVAADMESYDVLSVCEGSGLPAAVLRVISDDARSNLPDFNRAAEADGRMNPWRMASAMAARPMASLKFLRGLRPVINALRENLKIVLHA
jgi:nucleoside phosphorylase